MKKQIVIIFLFHIQLLALAQKDFVRKTTDPCSDKMTDTIKGKWLKPVYDLGPVNTQQQEVLNRLFAINRLVTAAYPVPTGADEQWSGLIVKTSFADQLKYVMNQNEMVNEEKVKTNPVSRLQYNLILFPYYCTGTNEIGNLYPEVSSRTGLTIHANYLSIVKGNVLDEEGMIIEGRPIKYKMPVIGKWKGYDMLVQEGGSNAELFTTHYVLITRKGILPYIPVTRKQYLDRAILYVTKFLDKQIAEFEVLQPDKVQREELQKNYRRQKEDLLKKYKDELENTTKEGLLESPAIILPGTLAMPMGSVFSTEAAGGQMLVTENPDYFRKDLMRYVPQFFVLEWSWKNEPWSLRFKKAFEENFQIKNLQEMIDK